MVVTLRRYLNRGLREGAQASGVHSSRIMDSSTTDSHQPFRTAKNREKRRLIFNPYGHVETAAVKALKCQAQLSSPLI